MNGALKLINDEKFDVDSKLKIINNAFEKAHSLKFLEEEHYKMWLDMLCLNTDYDREGILKVMFLFNLYRK